MKKSLRLNVLAVVLITGGFISYTEKANANILRRFAKCFHRSSTRRSSSGLRATSSLAGDVRGDSGESLRTGSSLRTESGLRGSNSSLASVSLSKFGIDDSSEDNRPVFVNGVKDGNETNSIFGHSVYDFDFNDVDEINPNYWYHQYKLQNREVITVISNKEPRLSYKVGSFQSDEKGESKFKYINWLSGKELLEFKKQSINQN